MAGSRRSARSAHLHATEEHEAVPLDGGRLGRGELYRVPDALGEAALAHEVVGVVVGVIESEVVAELVGEGPGGLLAAEQPAGGAIHSLAVLVARSAQRRQAAHDCAIGA